MDTEDFFVVTVLCVALMVVSFICGAIVSTGKSEREAVQAGSGIYVMDSMTGSSTFEWSGTICTNCSNSIDR
jgi:hypothetical protein